MVQENAFDYRTKVESTGPGVIFSSFPLSWVEKERAAAFSPGVTEVDFIIVHFFLDKDREG